MKSKQHRWTKAMDVFGPCARHFFFHLPRFQVFVEAKTAGDLSKKGTTTYPCRAYSVSLHVDIASTWSFALCSQWLRCLAGALRVRKTCTWLMDMALVLHGMRPFRHRHSRAGKTVRKRKLRAELLCEAPSLATPQRWTSCPRSFHLSSS